MRDYMQNTETKRSMSLRRKDIKVFLPSFERFFDEGLPPLFAGIKGSHEYRP